MDTKELSWTIYQSLKDNKENLVKQWNIKHSNFATRFFVCDDLISEELVKDFINHLPSKEELSLKSSLRERKRIGIDLDRYNPIIGKFLLAFQDPIVVDIISEITGIQNMKVDPTLYASGISIMEKDDFLNPHIDNSHDGDQELYRVLNLLYYVSPNWKPEHGGNLELWDIDISEPFELHAKFNRLVIMETTNTSYHSVNKVNVEDRRVCVSNYYFAQQSSNNQNYRHVTTFTGRPEEPIKKAALMLVDQLFLNSIAKLFPSLIKKNKHRRKIDTKN